MTAFTGGCHCGAVRYAYEGSVHRFSYCHCDDCRKIGGAAYSAAVVVDTDGFTLTAGTDQLTGYASSPGKLRRFCRRCGAHVVAGMEQRPGILIVRAGTIDTMPADLAPQMHIWVKAKPAWYDIHDALPQFAEGYQPAETPHGKNS